jgi:hypothetical protein
MKDKEVELIKFDYERTQDFVDKADGFLFQIRNWAMVSCSAVVTYAVSEKNGIVLLANIFLVFGFCTFELIYKSFHEDCIRKGYELEKLLLQSLDTKSELPSDYQFGIGHAIRVPRFKGLVSILFNRNRWHIGIVYLALLIMTALAGIYIHYLC